MNNLEVITNGKPSVVNLPKAEIKSFCLELLNRITESHSEATCSKTSARDYLTPENVSNIYPKSKQDFCA